MYSGCWSLMRLVISPLVSGSFVFFETLASQHRKAWILSETRVGRSELAEIELRSPPVPGHAMVFTPDAEANARSMKHQARTPMNPTCRSSCPDRCENNPEAVHTVQCAETVTASLGTPAPTAR